MPGATTSGYNPTNYYQGQQLQAQTDLIGVQTKAAQQTLQMQKRLSDLLFGGKGDKSGGRYGNILDTITGTIGGMAGGGGGGSGNLPTGMLPYPGGSGGGGGDLIGQFGAAQRARINQQFKDTTGSALARLEERGLGGSSLVGSAQAGIEDIRQQSMLGLEESVLEQNLGVKERAADRSVELFKALLGGLGGLF